MNNHQPLPFTPDNPLLTIGIDLLTAIDRKLAFVVEYLQTDQADYVSIQQAVKITGLSDSKIRRAIKQGELLARNVGSNLRATWRIKKSDLDAWMKKNGGGHSSPPPVPVFERNQRRSHFR